MLRLQSEPGALLVEALTGADESSVQEVPGVELDARFRGPDLQEAT